MYPGHLYVAVSRLNLGLPPPQEGQKGIFPKIFPSAHFSINYDFVPVLACIFKAKISFNCYEVRQLYCYMS